MFKLPRTKLLSPVAQEDKMYCADFKTEADCLWAPEVRCTWDHQGSEAGHCKCLMEGCKTFDLCVGTESESDCLDYSLPNGAKCKWGPSQEYPNAKCTCEKDGCMT